MSDIKFEKILLTCDEERSKLIADKFRIPNIPYNYLDYLSEDKIHDIKNAVIMTESRKIYDHLNDLNKRGVIHFGMRSYNYLDVRNMDFVNMGNNFYLIISDIDIHEGKEFLKKFKYLATTDFNKVPILSFDDNTNKIVNIDEGIEVLDEFSNVSEIGYDYETKNFPTMDNFRIVGVGLSDGKNLNRYIDFRYYKDKEVKKKFIDKYIEFICDKHDTLWAFNKAFEMHAFYRLSGKVVDINDAMAMAKCDHTKGTLKYLAQYYLHIESWDDYQDFYMNDVENLMDKSCDYENHEILLDVINFIWNKLEITELNKEIIDSLDNDKLSILYDEWKSTSNKSIDFSKHKDIYLNNHMGLLRDSMNFPILLNNLKNKWNQDFFMLKKYWGYSFATSPHELIGKYCPMDSFHTLHLKQRIAGEI